MKKLVVTLLLAAMTLSVVACGGKKNEEQNTTPSSSIESSVEESTEESSVEESTEAEDSENQGGEVVEGVTPQALKDAVVAVLGENYWPATEIPADVLETNYGVTADMYDAYVGELPMMMTNVDTLIIVQAKEGQVEAVEAALNAYRDMMVNDTMQYPMNLGKIQASRVDVIGNFVCFIQLGADVMDALEQGDAAVIEKCQEANQTAYDAIKAVVEQ